MPIILVGLKKDLRPGDAAGATGDTSKRSSNFVSKQQGQQTAEEVGAKKYLECSALTGEMVDEVFEAAARSSLVSFDKSTSSCCSLF